MGGAPKMSSRLDKSRPCSGRGGDGPGGWDRRSSLPEEIFPWFLGLPCGSESTCLRLGGLLTNLRKRWPNLHPERRGRARAAVDDPRKPCWWTERLGRLLMLLQDLHQ